jgi:hypothetical protein
MRVALLVLTLALLSGCGAGFYNPGPDPYVQAGDKGSPSDRTGGARPDQVPDPAYPPR